jgi:hypothetical protein
VEQRFHFLQDPAFVEAVLLPKPERIEALGYVMLRALLVFRGIERRGRQSPEPLPPAYRGAVARPTGQLLVPQGRGIQVLGRDDGPRDLSVPAAHRPALRGILQALGFSEAIDTTVPARAAPFPKI